MVRTKAPIVTLALTFGVAISGAGFAACGSSNAPIGRQQAIAGRRHVTLQSKAAPRKSTKAPKDQYGDPLPTSAVACLGTLSFRHQGDIVPWYLLFAPDGKTLLANTGDGVVMWDTSTGKVLRRFPANYWHAFDVSPDGKLLALSLGHTVVLDIVTGKQLFKVDCQISVVNSDSAEARFSPDGKTLVVSHSGKSLDKEFKVEAFLIDVATGRIRVRLDGAHLLYSLVFTPDSKRLAGLDYFGQPIRFFDVSTGTKVRSNIVQSDRGGGPLAFSPDGRTLARCIRQGVDLLEVTSGKVRATFEHQSTTMYNLAFSADGRFLLGGGDGGRARVWDVLTGKVLLDLDGQTDNRRCVAMSSDGKTVAMAGGGVIRLWDVATGKEIRCFDGHTADFTSLVQIEGTLHVKKC